MGGQGCSPQGAGPALPGSMCSSPLAAPSTDTAAPQSGPVPSKDAVQRREEHPWPTFQTLMHTHNTHMTHTPRAWDTRTSVPRERQVTLQTCEAAQAGNVASGAKGVWLMCRCTEHTRMLTSNKGSRRIKNIYTKLSELRFRSSSIKSL